MFIMISACCENIERLLSTHAIMSCEGNTRLANNIAQQFLEKKRQILHALRRYNIEAVRLWVLAGASTRLRAAIGAVAAESRAEFGVSGSTARTLVMPLAPNAKMPA
ncbi:MAG: hypothetical protein WBG92_16375 [Thiohalocapsa sp.]